MAVDPQEPADSLPPGYTFDPAGDPAGGPGDGPPDDPAAPLSVAPRPWDIQPDEPAQWFTMFAAYRDLGPGRSIDKAWRVCRPDAKPRAHPKVYYESKKWNWVDRARAYDIHLSGIAEQAAATAIRIEADRAERNRINFRANEAFLAHQGMVKVAELMALPLVQDTYAEKDGGKTIIHKRTVITPSHLFAMATLLKACSDIGRKGLGIKDEDISDQMTADRFQTLFYRTTGQLLRDLPSGAMPPMPAQVAVAPRIDGVAAGVESDGRNRFKAAKARP